VLDVLLGREARQRGYVLRTLLAAFGYLLGVVIAEVALSIGVAEGRSGARVSRGRRIDWPVSISYGMVRWGWTRNFRDPALTMTQMLVGADHGGGGLCQLAARVPGRAHWLERGGGLVWHVQPVAQPAVGR
jgi:hypothetical protein